MIGEIIQDKYRVLQLVGKGAMGNVYEGENLRIKRRVAIKILHAEVAENLEVSKLFEKEAQAAARIGSPHIVDVLDVGDLPNGRPYMVMELLEGVSLRDRIKAAGRLPAGVIFPLIIQLLEGLAKAHAAGVIHRDLKPGNIILVNDRERQIEWVKIIDFGVSKFHPIEGESDSDASVSDDGMMVGTPCFLSPELARGEIGFDYRGDLYAVGVILYKALSGRLPYRGTSVDELIVKIAKEPSTPIEHYLPDIDPAVRSIVNKAMALDPEDRYQSAHEFASALHDWLMSSARNSVHPLSASTESTRNLLTQSSDQLSLTPPPVSAEERAPVSYLKKRRSVVSASIAIVAVVGIVLGTLLWRKGTQAPEAQAAQLVERPVESKTDTAIHVDQPHETVQPTQAKAVNEPQQPQPTETETASIGSTKASKPYGVRDAKYTTKNTPTATETISSPTKPTTTDNTLPSTTLQPRAARQHTRDL